MRKFLLFLGALALIGAGCTQGDVGTTEGNWYLAFDLPSGWIMTPAYQLGSGDPASDDVSTEKTDIFLQSTDKPVYSSSGTISEDNQARVDAGEVIVENFTVVRVMKLDSRRVIPSEAEDLGGGFYEEKLCEDDDDCTLGGNYNYYYYFVNGDDKYRFNIFGDNVDIETAKSIIMSAKAVTVN